MDGVLHQFLLTTCFFIFLVSKFKVHPERTGVDWLMYGDDPIEPDEPSQVDLSSVGSSFGSSFNRNYDNSPPASASSQFDLSSIGSSFKRNQGYSQSPPAPPPNQLDLSSVGSSFTRNYGYSPPAAPPSQLDVGSIGSSFQRNDYSPPALPARNQLDISSVGSSFKRNFAESTKNDEQKNSRGMEINRSQMRNNGGDRRGQFGDRPGLPDWNNPPDKVVFKEPFISNKDMDQDRKVPGKEMSSDKNSQYDRGNGPENTRNSKNESPKSPRFDVEGRFDRPNTENENPLDSRKPRPKNLEERRREEETISPVSAGRPRMPQYVDENTMNNPGSGSRNMQPNRDGHTAGRHQHHGQAPHQQFDPGNGNHHLSQAQHQHQQLNGNDPGNTELEDEDDDPPSDVVFYKKWYQKISRGSVVRIPSIFQLLFLHLLLLLMQIFTKY